MSTPAQARAIAKYDAANTTQVKMKLNKKTDADILARLDEVAITDPIKGKQGYIKDLIRSDIQNKKCPAQAEAQAGTFTNSDA